MEMEVEESEFDLDISELPSGIYFVRLNVGKKSLVKKLVICDHSR